MNFRCFLGLSSVLFFIFPLKVNAQSNCDCTIFPVVKSCEVFCLTTATSAQLQKGFKLDEKTAKSIAAVNNRKSFKQIEDFKPYLRPAVYETLIETVYNNSINQTNTNGTNVAGNQVNNYYNTPSPAASQSQGSKPTTSTEPGSTPSDLSQTISGIIITIDKCVFSNDLLTVYFTFQNVSPTPDLKINFGNKEMNMYDDDGNLFHSIKMTVGNVEGKNYGSTYYELLAGIQAHCHAEFAIANMPSKIARLEIVKGYYFKDIPVTR